MRKILVPLDGSALAGRAVPFAATLAASAHSDIVRVRAVSTFSVSSGSAGEVRKREAHEALNVTDDAQRSTAS
jgi:nucleotide-binding universal stress UspA family protein